MRQGNLVLVQCRKKPMSITVEAINYELDPALTKMVTNESLGERTKALTLLQSKLDKISISKVKRKVFLLFSISNRQKKL